MPKKAADQHDEEVYGLTQADGKILLIMCLLASSTEDFFLPDYEIQFQKLRRIEQPSLKTVPLVYQPVGTI